ncbi:MAG TPA: diacylglycerol kinase family protein [Dongiaceae bacterium]
MLPSYGWQASLRSRSERRLPRRSPTGEGGQAAHFSEDATIRLADANARLAEDPALPAQVSASRILIIRNPTSGRRRGALRQVIAHLEEMGCRVTVHETTCRGDAQAVASRTTTAQYDRIAVAGGDGTVNEVLNGLTPDSPPVALIPMGTANVLAAEIGLSAQPAEIARTIVLGEARPVSLGDVDGKKFVLMTGVGFDAFVVATVSAPLKRILGKGAYILASLSQFLKGRLPRFEMHIDGVRYEAASMVIANARFYGGRFVCAPEARMDSDVLHVCLFERPGRFYVAAYALALLLGILHRMPGYRILPARHIEIRQPDGAAIQSDGDFVALTPARVTVMPRAAWLVFPRAPAPRAAAR